MLALLTLGLVVLFSTAAGETADAIPHKITLTSRVALRGASLKRRALSPTTIPLADFFKGTDLQCVTPALFIYLTHLSVFDRSDGLEIFQVSISVAACFLTAYVFSNGSRNASSGCHRMS